MIQLDTNSLSCFHCQVLLKRSGLAMPRSLPKMEMSQVHNGCVVSITFPFKNIFSDQKKYGSPLTEAVPIRKESHPFSKIMVSVLELGLLYPKMDQTNTAFLLGKMRFLCFRPWGQPKRVFRISIKKCIRSQNLRSDFPINKKAYMIYYDLICIHMHPFCMEELSPLLPLSMPCPRPEAIWKIAI